MANSYFRFKQFTINQEKCAMKVGTDGCLLGAWADLSGSCNILDIGCGSGLIALMAAQRCPDATITGIEIDADAASQAAENIAESPWADRIGIINNDFLSYQPQQKYDTILSNPPYFTNSMKCPDDKRNKARHDDTLTSISLLQHAYELLSEGGRLSIVIPADQQEVWQKQAEGIGYSVKRVTLIHTRANIAPKRVLMEFCKECGTTAIIEDFTLEDAPGCFTEEATKLLKPFYLKL